MKNFLILLSIFLIVGCGISQRTIPLPKNHLQKKTHLKNSEVSKTGFYSPGSSYSTILPKRKNTPKTLKFSGNGYIKGVIKKLYFLKKDKKWVYQIVGKDLKNGKLGYAEVYATKKIGKEGDFIYAVILDGYISSIYIYKNTKGYRLNNKFKYRKIIHKKNKLKKKMKNIAKPQNKLRKIGHRIQLISAPPEENILF